MASQVALVEKNPSSVCLQCGKPGSIPRWGKSPGAGNGNTIQYFCLENPMTEEFGWLQAMGSQTVQADWANNTYMHANAGDIKDPGLIPGFERFPGERNGNPLQYSCLENPMDRGAWQATIHGVPRSWTQVSDWACTHSLLHTHTRGCIQCQSHPTVHFFNVKRLYLQMLHREICQKPPSFRVDQFLKYIPTLHLCVLPFTGPPWFRLLQYHQVLRCLPSLPPFSQLDG